MNDYDDVHDTGVILERCHWCEKRSDECDCEEVDHEVLDQVF